MKEVDLQARLRSRRFPWLLVMIAFLLTPIAWALAYLAISTAQADNPPPCEGLGWGCTPGPDFGAVAIAILWVLGTAAVAIILLFTELFWRAVATPRSVVVLTVFAIGVAWLALMLGVTWWGAVT